MINVTYVAELQNFEILIKVGCNLVLPTVISVKTPFALWVSSRSIFTVLRHFKNILANDTEYIYTSFLPISL